mmetsp:Transcript_50608/g.134737  ORF Transcript_50608/g.134737 Transcript_50608/m.134737 type:complete len:247 (-) Transcript_50608:566-1306(-)
MEQRAKTLEAVQKNGRALRRAPDSLRDDKEVVLSAVRRAGLALEYASEALRRDREVVLVAVTNRGGALFYASEELKNDIDVVLAALAEDACALEHASCNMKNDKDVVLRAVRKRGLSLQYASDALQRDLEVVQAAVDEDFRSLEFADEETKGSGRVTGIPDSSVVSSGQKTLTSDKIVTEDIGFESAKEEFAERGLVAREGYMDTLILDQAGPKAFAVISCHRLRPSVGTVRPGTSRAPRILGENF